MHYLNKLQHRLWIDNASQCSNEYNVVYAFLIEGELDVDNLQSSLNRIVLANPIFRSTIIPDGRGVFFFKEDEAFVLPFEKVNLLNDSLEKEGIEVVIDYYARIPIIMDSCYLCKFYLFFLNENQWIFMPKFHLSVIDEMSLSAFCEQLSIIYNGELLPEVPTLEVYNECIQQSDCHRNQDYLYWKKYLSDTSLKVPFDLFDGKEAESDGIYDFYLGKELFQQCDYFCLSERTTMLQLLSAVWATSVGRFCRSQPEQVVLDYVVNLCTDDFRDTLGSYVNNLPLKVYTHSSLREKLLQIRSDFREAKLHQWMTYAELLPGMRSEGLLTIMDDWINVGLDYPVINNQLKFTFQHCTSQLFRKPQMDMKFDLCLAVEKGNEFHCQIRYKKYIPLYYVKELATAFHFLLEQSMNAPEIPMTAFSILVPEKEQALISHYSKTSLSVLPPSSIMERFVGIVFSNTCRPAIIFEGKRICYAELYVKSVYISNLIYREIKEAGKSNLPIGVLMKHTPDNIAVLLGILASGNTFVPLDNKFSKERLEYIMKDCGIGLLVTDRPLSWESNEIRVIIPEMDICDFYIELPLNVRKKIANDDVACIIYTSDTSGLSKGIPIYHHQLLSAVGEQVKLFQIYPNGKVLCWSEMGTFIFGIFTTLLSGSCLIIASEIEKDEPQRMLDLLEQEQVTCFISNLILLTTLPYRSFAALTTLVLVNDRFQLQIPLCWRNNKRVVYIYRPVENTICTSTVLSDDDERTPNIGFPLKNVTCYVLDTKMRLLPFGVPGELYIGVTQLTETYLNYLDLDKCKFVPNPFVSLAEKGINSMLYKSGDFVRLLPDYSLEFIGRTGK